MAHLLDPGGGGAGTLLDIRDLGEGVGDLDTDIWAAAVAGELFLHILVREELILTAGSSSRQPGNSWWGPGPRSSYWRPRSTY